MLKEIIIEYLKEHPYAGWYEVQAECVRQTKDARTVFMLFPQEMRQLVYEGLISTNRKPIYNYIAGATLDNLRLEASMWSLDQFKQQSLEGKLNHVKKEIKELEADPLNGEEMADIFLLLFSYAALADIDLVYEIHRKLKINKARTWGEMQEDGTVEHIQSD